MDKRIRGAALGCGLVLAGAGAASASELSGEITVWSWNIGADSLRANVESFVAQHPDVTVIVEDVGVDQVPDRMLAGCAAGGVGLPDVVSLQNRRSEIFWLQFPDCFYDLRDLGFTDEVGALFPDYKRTELEVGDTVFAMPWDAGPVMMFYRRDFYEAAGVDPADIVTWDDFMAAGERIMAANPGVVMTQATINSDAEFFEMIGNENGCAYFSQDGASITLTDPACVEALEIVKAMHDRGLMAAADWTGKVQSSVAGTVATHMFGGWYEGTIRTNVPDEQSGLWGVYRMPGVHEGGRRAANFGGSAIAIPSTSENPDIAFAFLMHALATVEGQVRMLELYGLVPSLLGALDHPYVQQPIDFWGGQAVWAETLETLDSIMQVRGTPFYDEANGIMVTEQLDYLNGRHDSAEAALAEAARQISLATGLPIR